MTKYQLDDKMSAGYANIRWTMEYQSQLIPLHPKIAIMSTPEEVL